MYAIFFHAHQKIDRIAHKHLERLTGEQDGFPAIKEVLHFEGRNGPDATKLKNNSGVEQPWHFMNPFDNTDTELSEAVQVHYDELVVALKDSNRERSAFEAAWLAHALVDGLTPAHHYPYEAALEELRGEGRSSRVSLKSRAIVKGETTSDSIKRSLQIIGPRGLLTTHTTFEAGAYMIMMPLKLTSAFPTADDLKLVRELGIGGYFQQVAREVGARGMFEEFLTSGWTPKLARIVRKEMAPRMVSMVTLAWFSALVDAGLVREEAL
jgi:hypothetical protein